MRTVSFLVKNDYKLEIFAQKLKEGFEIWVVGPIDGERIILDHHQTHDDLEGQLEYAKPRDLLWRDANHSEIPVNKNAKAIEMEKTMQRGDFCDWSPAAHFDSMAFLPKDRKASNVASKAMLGNWTDGRLTFNLMTDNKLEWSCTDQKHWLGQGRAPDWWNFAAWRLFFMNDMHTPQAAGAKIHVFNVSDKELHVQSDNPNRIAHVFWRVI